VPAARQSRLPLEPLVQRCGSVSALARATGIERTQLARWRSNGVPLDSADRVAIAAGCHPAEVWPDWYILTTLLDGQAA
jgi:lambda repressor-like predicted transcriptional regulator